MGTEPGETYEAAKIPESGQTRSPTVLPVKRRREWQEQYAKEQKEPAAGEQQDGSPDEMEDVNDDQDTLQDSEPDQPVAVNSRQVNQPYPPEIVVAETHIIDTRPLLQEVEYSAVLCITLPLNRLMRRVA